MKHLPLIALAALLVGCDPVDGSATWKSTGQSGMAYSIVLIEDCEYIATHVKAGYSITHKGNCTNHVRIGQ